LFLAGGEFSQDPTKPPKNPTAVIQRWVTPGGFNSLELKSEKNKGFNLVTDDGGFSAKFRRLATTRGEIHYVLYLEIEAPKESSSLLQERVKRIADELTTKQKLPEGIKPEDCTASEDIEFDKKGQPIRREISLSYYHMVRFARTPQAAFQRRAFFSWDPENNTWRREPDFQGRGFQGFTQGAV